MTHEFLTAVIRAEECIGCSRCIPVCPVDAIIGTNQYLHTVLLNECIGCKLCVNSCPVDCIDMVPLANLLPIGVRIDKQSRGMQAKKRYKARQLRLQQEAQRILPVFYSDEEKRNKIRAEIQESLARVRAKRDA